MVLLVPRQLRMAGVAGNVPYYGGRLSPTQAYAASHSQGPPPAAAAPPSEPRARRDPREALEELLRSEVITQEEYDDLRARLGP